MSEGFDLAKIKEEGGFKADFRQEGSTLNIALSGRLDTGTSPALLTQFREAQAKGGFSRICLDAQNLKYISSAGLRVFLIMRKTLAGSEYFSIENMNKSVKDTIETTGFDTIFFG